jgi:(1->4)-alpha-D-glucan 1-alpha-D-glucosylmutase
VARDGKDLAARELLGSELNRLTALALAVCERHRRYRDYTRHDLHEALREVATSFPVYRSYVRAAEKEIDPADRVVITRTMGNALARRPDLPADLFDFLRQVLTLELTGDLETELVMRFQQLTGAVMAKGVEDTAFYRYARLLSLNEVGGDPAQFGAIVEGFHAQNARAAAEWPVAMLAGTTHDTKRSDDTRARISVLSEMPAEWEAALHRWAYLNERFRQDDAPDRNVEYFLYQTLVGAWPISLERVVSAMDKSIHEMKERTAWTRPDPGYDQAVRAFVESVVSNEPFVRDLETFLERLLPAARTASLATTLLRITSVGVPDIYQGSELWDERLVDPDNRRPVDFERRRALLATAASTTAEEALAETDSGLSKLFLLRAGLAARHRHPEAFQGGGYTPLSATGSRAGHLVAFQRGNDIVAIAPRLCLTLGSRPDDWADTALGLPSGNWCDAIAGSAWTGGRPLLARDLLTRFPVALLERVAAA